MFSKGQTVTIRRYKDLCCEYSRTEGGDIDSPWLFNAVLRLFCGCSFEITRVVNPTDYEVSLPPYLWFSGWRFEDRFFEESNSQRGDDNETN